MKLTFTTNTAGETTHSNEPTHLRCCPQVLGRAGGSPSPTDAEPKTLLQAGQGFGVSCSCSHFGTRVPALTPGAAPAGSSSPRHSSPSVLTFTDPSGPRSLPVSNPGILGSSPRPLQRGQPPTIDSRKTQKQKATSRSRKVGRKVQVWHLVLCSHCPPRLPCCSHRHLNLHRLILPNGNGCHVSPQGPRRDQSLRHSARLTPSASPTLTLCLPANAEARQGPRGPSCLTKSWQGPRGPGCLTESQEGP